MGEYKIIEAAFNDNGITVGELKNWLEQFNDDGGVWIEIENGLSNEVVELWELNNQDILLKART